MANASSTSLPPFPELSHARIMFYLERPDEMQTVEQADVMMSRAVPFFIIFIVLEILLTTMLGKRVYRVNDATTSMMMGSISQQLQLWGKPAMLMIYGTIHQRYRLVTFDTTSWPTYIMLLLIIDLLYYFFHRFSHEYHFAWSMHSVHHSGEDMNLATALRQGAAQWLIGFFFNLPVALIIPLGPYFAHSAGNLLFQFWFHTPVIGWMGPLEYVLNTPSSHRMHHRPPGNQNYGGVLIIWDRMFGTFKAEEEHMDYYGLAKQYNSFDPLWASAEHSWRVVNNVDDGKSKLNALFRKRLTQPMVFKPLDLFKPIPKPRNAWTIPDKSHRVKFDPSIPFLMKVYCVLAFVGYLGFSVVLGIWVDQNELALGSGLAFRQAVLFTAASCIGKLFAGESGAASRNSVRALLTFMVSFVGGASWEVLVLTFVDFIVFQCVRAVVG